MKPIQLLLRWDNWRQRRWRRFWEIRKLRLPKIFSFQFPKRFSTKRWHHSPPHMPRLREGFNEGLRRWGKVLPAEMGCIKKSRIYFLSVEFTHLLCPLQKLFTHTVRGCPWCFSGYGVEWGGGGEWLQMTIILDGWVDEWLQKGWSSKWLRCTMNPEGVRKEYHMLNL